MSRIVLALGLLCLLVPAVSAENELEMAVKVSLSREDPNVRVGEADSDDLLHFYVFVDGGPSRGAEFGLAIEGADYEAFLIDTEHVWISMPMRDPYPGTIGQVIVGSDCPDAPLFYGRLSVKPHEAGGRVVVDVIPSLRENQAVVVDCDNLPLLKIRGYPATVNPAEKAARPHRVQGDHADPNEPNANRIEAGQ